MTKIYMLLFNLVFVVFTFSIQAATINVVNGGCTLNDAIRAANDDTSRGDCSAGSGNDTISLPDGFDLTLTSALPTINSDLTIESVNANLAGIGGNNQYRVFDINTGQVVFNRLRIYDGERRGIASQGGAGVRIKDASLIINDCELVNNIVFSTNTGGGGINAENSSVEINDSFLRNGSSRVNMVSQDPIGGIDAIGSEFTIRRSTIISSTLGNSQNRFNGGTLTVKDSLFKASAQTYGPQLVLLNNATVDMVNTTLHPGENGSARLLMFDGADLSLVNTTLNGALNVLGNGTSTVRFINTIMMGSCTFDSQPNAQIIETSSFFSDDSCTGAATPGNLFLLSLSDNGGPTQTQAVHWLSDTINTGDNVLCPPADQRGVLRDSLCDIGAYERVDQADTSVSVAVTSASPYPIGQELVITVMLDNSGPGTASDAELSMNFTNLQVNSIQGACTTNPCTLTTLLANTPRTVLVYAEPNNINATTFSMSAQLSPTPEAVYVDNNSTNDSANLTEFRGVSADLSVEKTLQSTPPFAIGQPVQYEIVVTNNGPNGASNIQLVDQPQGLTIQSITNCSSPTTGNCVFNALLSGDSETMIVTAKVTANKFDNEASVSADEFDHQLNNNTDDKGNQGNASTDADLRLGIINLTQGTDYKFKNIQYQIGVSNQGPDTATNVRLDFIQDGFFITAISGACNTIPCAMGNIAVSQTSIVTVNGFINTSGSGSFSVSTQSDQNDINPANNTDTDNFNARLAADVSTSLTLLTQAPYYQGQTITYRLTIMNNGLTADYANDIALLLTPDNLLIDAVISDSCVALPCSIPALGPSETEVIDVQATIQNVGMFDLTAQATATQYDPVPDNNIDDTNNGGAALLVEDIFSDGFE